MEGKIFEVSILWKTQLRSPI